MTHHLLKLNNFYRHRFTATYLSRLIKNDFESPHRVLNALISRLASFTPTDADNFITAKPALPPIQPHRSFDFLQLTKDAATLYQTVGFIFDYIFTGKPRSLCGKTGEKLVELGFARFRLVMNGNKDATADEPLAILAAAHFFSIQNLAMETFLLHGIAVLDGTAQGPAFKHFGAYMLALAFRSLTQLDSVFYEFFNLLKNRSYITRLRATLTLV